MARLLILFASAVLALVPAAHPASAEPANNWSTPTARFVGDTRCGNPTCHGAPLPRPDAPRGDWKPWKSARTQWSNRNIDHHSRAYVDLTTEAGKTIATYMGISATESDKCLACHAPPAQKTADSGYRKEDGVTCEHCHGPAENWLKVHVERDWKSKRQQYVSQGFYNNADFRLRAEKCAGCHVEIDHEIVAGGHPPLQFEMVAYAQIMKHWDDQEDLPAGSFSVDPTLWAVGQLVGLREAAAMVARRAGDSNYQSIGQFSHFKDRNCYQCHHKLIEDAMRQAQGHYLMADALLGVAASDRQGELTGLWSGLLSAVRSSAGETQQQAGRLQAAADRDATLLRDRRLDRDTTRKLLGRITSSGDKLKTIKRFSFSRPETSNVLRIEGIDNPWWYTTGAPEQAILAIEALCEPGFAGKCGGGPGGIRDDLKRLLTAVDRFDYRPDQFVQALGAINQKLR